MAKNNLNLTIIEEDSRWLTAIEDMECISNKIVEVTHAFLVEHEKIDLLNNGKILNLNLALDNDENVHELNKQYRNIDKPTNVLSFANIDNDDFLQECETFDDIDLGDIIIAFETMQKEAEIKSIPLRWHFSHLFIHGILHLLGFDHQNDDDANYMESLEIKILKELNIPNPYQD